VGWRWSGTKNGKSWISAPCLEQLGRQLIERDPNRDVTPDGTAASSQHSINNPTSDHEPDKVPVGIVCAIDIAHNDDTDGTDVWALFESLRIARDPRIKYAIKDSLIFTSYDHRNGPAWEWRTYSGANPHTSPGHLSCRPEPEFYNDDSPWPIAGGGPAPIPPVGEDDEMVLKQGNPHREANRQFQEALNVVGAGLEVDGYYGTLTATAVVNFQSMMDLPPTGEIDGIVAALLI